MLHAVAGDGGFLGLQNPTERAGNGSSLWEQETERRQSSGGLEAILGGAPATPNPK
jgi:hypothetical protein